MRAFDLSGTLVNIDYNADQLITAIYDAKMIYLPIGPFVIITAQQDSAPIQKAIRAMVANNYPKCERIYFVNGTPNEIIAKKIERLKAIEATEYTDDNRDILAAIRIRLPEITLYVMTARGRALYK